LNRLLCAFVYAAPTAKPVTETCGNAAAGWVCELAGGARGGAQAAADDARARANAPLLLTMACTLSDCQMQVTEPSPSSFEQ
jgi:hypothetical protein